MKKEPAPAILAREDARAILLEWMRVNGDAHWERLRTAMQLLLDTEEASQGKANEKDAIIRHLVRACLCALPGLNALANISGHGQPTDEEEALIHAAVARANTALGERLAGCDCDQDGHPDPAVHASDCAAITTA